MPISTLIRDNLLTRLPVINKKEIVSHLSNSTLSTLIEPLIKWHNHLRSNQSTWDAILTPATASQDLFAKLTEKAGDENLAATISVSAEEAESLALGFFQAVGMQNQLLKADGDFSENTTLAITSAIGQGFVFQPYYDEVESKYNILNVFANGYNKLIEYNADGSATVRVYLFPVGYINASLIPSVQNDTFVSNLQWISNYLNVSTVDNTIISIISAIEHATGDNILSKLNSVLLQYNLETEDTITDAITSLREYCFSHITLSSKGVAQSFGVIFMDLFKSNAVNSVICEVIDSIRATKLPSLLSDFRSSEGALEEVSSLRNQISSSYHSGGITGVISFLISILRSGSSTMVDEDTGLLVFTDNNQLCPKSFMVGFLSLISNVVSALAQAVAVICSSFMKLVGIATSLLSSLVGNVVNAATSVIKAKVVNGGIYNEDNIILPYCPYGFFQTEYELKYIRSAVFKNWFLAQCEAGNLCFYFKTTGGAVFFGPGSLNDKGVPETVRIEFHPAICKYSDDLHYGQSFFHYQDAMLHEWNCFDFWNFSSLLDYLGYEDIEDADAAYECLMNNFAVDVMNDASGYLSDVDSYRVNGAAALNTLLFLFSITGKMFIPDLYMFKISLDGAGDDPFTDFLSTIQAVFWSWEGHVDPHWDLTANAAIHSSNGNIILYGYEGTPGLLNLKAHECRGQYLVQNCLNNMFEEPLGMSMNFSFALIPPAYTAQSFWTAIILTGLVTIATAALTIFATVKLVKWTKRKKAENVAKFSRAQEKFQESVSGVKTTFDPATGEYVTTYFDVNSAEGKQYIKDCFKDWKLVQIKNNLWQKFIGGTRYDVTTFWGEAESGEEASSLNDLARRSEDELNSASSDQVSSSVVSQSPYSATISGIYKVITGSDFSE